MKTILSALLILLCLTWHPSIHAGLIVVVHKDNPVNALSSRQITDIYMGRSKAYPNGRAADTSDHPKNSQIKKDFYARLLGKSIAQVNAYWARLLFTGKAEPPTTKPSKEDVVRFVLNNENAIAYLYDTTPNDNLKVVYTFENSQ